MDAEVPKGRGLADKVSVPGGQKHLWQFRQVRGVGKSTVAVNLAVSLALDGAARGSDGRRCLRAERADHAGRQPGQARKSKSNQLIPVEAYGVKLISMAVLQPGDKPRDRSWPNSAPDSQTVSDGCEVGELDLPKSWTCRRGG